MIQIDYRCVPRIFTKYHSLFVAAVFPAIFIVLASYAGCNKLLVVVWFTLAMGFMVIAGKFLIKT